jgi:hypothetical protein
METESWDDVEVEQGNTMTVTAQSETTSTETTVWRNSETSSGKTTSDRDTVSVFTQDSDSEESEDRGDQIEESDDEDNMTKKCGNDDPGGHVQWEERQIRPLA